jgi:hypothetical protein
VGEWGSSPLPFGVKFLDVSEKSHARSRCDILKIKCLRDPLSGRGHDLMTMPWLFVVLHNDHWDTTTNQ